MLDAGDGFVKSRLMQNYLLLSETESLVIIGVPCFSWGLCVCIFIMQIRGCGCPAFQL